MLQAYFWGTTKQSARLGLRCAHRSHGWSGSNEGCERSFITTVRANHTVAGWRQTYWPNFRFFFLNCGEGTKHGGRSLCDLGSETFTRQQRRGPPTLLLEPLPPQLTLGEENNSFKVSLDFDNPPFASSTLLKHTDLAISPLWCHKGQQYNVPRI